MGRTSRRKFIAGTALMAGVAVVRRTAQAASLPDAGAPAASAVVPATAPSSITPTTISESLKLVELDYTAAHQAQVASSWKTLMGAALKDRRAYHPAASVVPGSLWDPRLPGAPRGPSRTRTQFSRSTLPLPTRDEDIAYAPVTALSAWL